MGGFEQKPWTPTKRRGPIAAEFANPGPACVQLPQLLGTRIVESKKTAAPAFSFGSRYLGKHNTFGPGPGESFNFPLQGFPVFLSIKYSPFPHTTTVLHTAQYNVSGLAAKGKDTPPQISLQSRSKPNKIIETPAPGEYHIEKSDKYIVSSAPKYTFGVKKYCGITNYETPGKFLIQLFFFYSYGHLPTYFLIWPK